jgi:peptidyl-prolyl cis-trans isomerase C
MAVCAAPTLFPFQPKACFMNRTPSLALVLALGLVTAPPVLAQDASADGAAAENPVVAIVDGTEFRLSDLEASYQELPEQFRQMPMQMLYDPLVDRLVDGHLLLKAAENANVAADPEVQAAIEQARADVLRQTLIERAVADATDEASLQAAYEARKAVDDFAVEQVTARHILVETEQLDAGADFAELAREHSTDPAAERGGELGTFPRGSMVPPFEEAAFAMEPGSHSSEPVQTQFGYHVILVEAKEAVEPTFAELEPELRAELTRAAVEELLAEVRADAEIERFAIDGNPLPADAEAGAAAQ